MTLRLITVASLALGLAGVGSAQRSTEAPAVLRKVISASPKMRFAGTRVVEMKLGPERIRHVEHVSRDGSKMRLEFPDEGPHRGQVVVETKSERRHYFPDRNEIRVLPPRRDESAGRLRFLVEKLKGKVLFSEGNGGEVANLDTRVVTVTDMNGNPLQKLWIYPKAGFVLKRELYDRSGTVRGFFEYTKINFQPRFNSRDFQLSVSGAKVITPRDHLQELIRSGGFQSVYLPTKDPYRLESARISRHANQAMLVQTYVSANGRITLIQLKQNVDPEMLKRMTRGETRTYSWKRNGANFVLVGEIGEDKLRQIAGRLQD